MSCVKQLKQSNNEANKNNFIISNNGKNKKILYDNLKIIDGYDKF